MIQKGHRIVKEFKPFLEDLGYDRLPRNFHVNLLKYCVDKDTTVGNIYLNKFLSKPEIKQLIERNKVRLNIDSNENIQLEQHKDRVFKYVEHAKKIMTNINKNITETRDEKYHTLKEDEEDENCFLPTQDTQLIDIKLAFFKNNDVLFKFNKDIPSNGVKFDNYVHTVKLEIRPTGGQIIMPTKYTVRCTEKTEMEGECGNIVRFCDIHKNSKIKCTDNHTLGKDYGHIIKNLSEAPVEESKKFFMYTAKDINNQNEDSVEFLVYSCEKIEREIVTAHCIFVDDLKQPYLMLLCIDSEEKIAELDYKVLKKDSNNLTFLDDIYESIKDYTKKEHNIKITNQNRIIGKYMMFQVLAKVFFNTRFHSLIMGKSGAGKSFFSEILLPLFTFKYVVTPGGSVSRNRFLGGQDKYKNSLPGMVVTQDIVFIEEGTDEINKFLDPKRFNKTDAFFNWVKVCTGKEYDVGVQGTGKMYPKASLIMVGNIDQLDILVDEYKSKVAKKYKLYTNGKAYTNSLPLFKPLKFYEYNIDLMNAHGYVRTEEYKRLSYRTGLPEAEESRFSIIIILEEDDRRSEISEIPLSFGTGNKERLILHRKNFVSELKELFDNNNIPESFKEAVETYVFKEFFQKNNNFTPYPGFEINNHVKKSIGSMIYLFIVMDKLYWNDNFILTESDKVKVEDFLRYNYNCLNSEQSTGYGKKPPINDYSLIRDSNLFDSTLDKKKEYSEKLREEEKKNKTLKFNWDDKESKDEEFIL